MRSVRLFFRVLCALPIHLERLDLHAVQLALLTSVNRRVISAIFIVVIFADLGYLGDLLVIFEILLISVISVISVIATLQPTSCPALRLSSLGYTGLTHTPDLL